ncbi:MAG: hypothetical protein ACXVNO_04730 [Bacteroidia bacterium]
MNTGQRITGKKVITTLVTFTVFGCVALYYCWWQNFYPSMDGPSHFYNSLLLKEYFSGNTVIQTNFSLTPFYNPNLFSTYFIALLYCFFSFKTVAFLFFFLYFIFSFYSARALLKSYNIRLASLLALCMVLFFNSTLFNLGFYNFSWSIIFLFLIISYFRNNLSLNKRSLKVWIIYVLLLVLVYYSNALTFIFYLFYLLVFEVDQIKWKKKSGINEQLKERFPFIITNLLLLLPFLILLICFYIQSPIGHGGAPNNIKTYNELLIDMS